MEAKEPLPTQKSKRLDPVELRGKRTEATTEDNHFYAQILYRVTGKMNELMF